METLSYQYTRHLAGRRACRVLSPHGLWSAQALFVVYALLKSTWLLFHGGIELIHLGDPILAPLGCLFWCLFHVPVACNAHGLDIVYPNRFYQALVVGSLRQLSLVICISQYARQECLRRGVPAARCVVIPPGIVVDEVAPEAGGASVIPAASRSGERYVLLTVGRLVRRKGVVEFIRHVLPRLLALRQDWVYWVVGDGPDLESARDECRRLGLGGYCVFLGAPGRCRGPGRLRTGRSVRDAKHPRRGRR
jgi:phosphatidylinositol alpha-1,6-mannosyltransferase